MTLGNLFKMLVDSIREEFYKRLSRKTGWGKEELKIEFESACQEGLLRIIDKIANEEKKDG